MECVGVGGGVGNLLEISQKFVGVVGDCPSDCHKIQYDMT